MLPSYFTRSLFLGALLGMAILYACNIPLTANNYIWVGFCAFLHICSKDKK